MKRVYKLCFSLMLTIGLSYYSVAQTSLGTSESLLGELKKDLSSKSSSRAVSSVDLDVPGSSFNGKVNYKQSEAGSEFLIGEVDGVAGSSFIIKATDQSLEGHIILKGTKKAYKYFSDASGNAFVEEVDINSVICIDYENLPSKKQKTEAQAREAADISPALLDLQSLPGAAGVVLLDFDGYYMPAGNYWNNGNAINAAPSGMSDDAVREHWEVVSEDYRPFNVNITTNEAVFNSYPRNRRMRVVVTPTNTAAPGAGGVAYLGSFNWDNDVPCWVFITSGKSGGDASSHEIGHCFDLQHDGRSNPDEGYFLGIDKSAWAPIMGAGYYRPIVQWSRGEYRYAKNDQPGVLQDDIATIAGSKFGVGFRGDDYGNSTGAAANLDYNAGGTINQKSGLITNEADWDFFKFTTGGGNVVINANTVSRDGNLDIIIRLYNSAGQEIANANPTTPGFIDANNRDAQFYAALNASLNVNIGAGTYYVSIDGTGANDPAYGGYSAYGSLGTYYITGTIPPGGGSVNPSTGILTAYKDCNFTGFNGGFGVGNFTNAQMNAVGVLNDDISSLKIAKGYKVILYENDNFSGASIEYTSEQGCLVAAGWNDRVSSLKVMTNDANIATGYYKIVNQFSGKVLDVNGISLSEGAKIISHDFLNGANQKWKIERDGAGFYYMTAVHSGQVLDIPYCNYANGTVVQQVNSNGSDCQRFKIIDIGGGFFKIVAKGTSKVLDGGVSNQNGANVYLWDWADVSNQSWNFQLVNDLGAVVQNGTYRLINKQTGKAMGVKTAGTANGTPITIYDYIGAENQKWKIEVANTVDGFFGLTAVHSNSSLDIPGCNYNNGTGMQQYTSNLSTCQKFKLMPVEDGYFVLIAKTTGKCVDGGVNGQNDSPVYLWDYANVSNQKWKIELITNGPAPNVAPSVSLTSPVNNASVNAPGSISIAANASDSDGSVAKVQFYNGGTLLSEDGSSPYSYTWSNVAAGTYTITAKAIDDKGAVTTSSAISVTVKTVTVDQCSGVAQYVENGGYVAGSKAKNAGRKYECKEWPYSGWCNGAAWAYGPGTGAYWTDAWYDRGTCTPSTGGASSNSSASESLTLSPNPVQGELNISSTYSLSGASLMIIDATGKTVYNSGASESISTADLDAGIYTLILVTSDNQKLTKRFVKMK
jgi:hypothetical protein